MVTAVGRESFRFSWSDSMGRDEECAERAFIKGVVDSEYKQNRVFLPSQPSWEVFELPPSQEET